jgi:cysteine synthase B
VVAHSSVLELIGNTPIVDISALSPNPHVRILAKLEGQNPGGSIKDRIAWQMVQEAEADGTLRAGRTIIEPSSGNTGIALAMIARTRGYRIKIVMPENVSPERRQALEVWGAEIILTPGDEGSNGAVRRAQQLADEHPEWVFLYQYANEANPRSHYETTGPEIWRDFPDVTHFVAGLGTTGTLMGVGRFLKEQNPEVKIVAIEPPLGERVEGLRNLDDGYIPPVYEKWGGPDLLDRKRIVRPRESIEWTRRLTEDLLGHLGRCGAGRRGQGRLRGPGGHDRGDPGRRRLEVPVHRRLDRRHRHRRRTRRAADRLLTPDGSRTTRAH